MLSSVCSLVFLTTVWSITAAADVTSKYTGELMISTPAIFTVSMYTSPSLTPALFSNSASVTMKDSSESAAEKTGCVMDDPAAASSAGGMPTASPGATSTV